MKFWNYPEKINFLNIQSKTMQTIWPFTNQRSISLTRTSDIYQRCIEIKNVFWILNDELVMHANIKFTFIFFKKYEKIKHKKCYYTVQVMVQKSGVVNYANFKMTVHYSFISRFHYNRKEIRLNLYISVSNANVLICLEANHIIIVGENVTSG